MDRWAWRIGKAVAVLSGLSAIGLLSLPLLLLLLMLLFDSTAHGLLTLLGLVVSWLGTLLPGGSGNLPAYNAMALDPLPVAAEAALRSAPCLLGLVLALLCPRPGARWWWVALPWAVAAAADGGMVAVALLPGLLAAALLAAWPRCSAPASGGSGWG